ncbi:MAG TPA: hypothetical protein PK636_07220, partial [bacterium]|nr:hypothetical protein [bacterium]
MGQLPEFIKEKGAVQARQFPPSGGGEGHGAQGKGKGYGAAAHDPGDLSEAPPPAVDVPVGDEPGPVVADPGGRDQGLLALKQAKIRP